MGHAAPNQASLVAGGLALLGGGLLLLWNRSGGSVSLPRIGDGCPAGSPDNPAPKSSDEPAAKRAPAVAARLRRLWSEATGDPGPPCEAAIEMALAHSWMESGIADATGGWWTDKTNKGAGNMVGSRNLGARQCSSGSTGGSYFDCVEYGDSKPNADGTQTKYAAKFRYYKAGATPDGVMRDADDAAAWDFLHDVSRVWGGIDELNSGDVRAYARKLYQKGYYQGFGATEAERVGGYAKAIASRLPAVAAALGHEKILAIIDPNIYQYGKTYVAPSNVAQASVGDELQQLYNSGALLRAKRSHDPWGSIIWHKEHRS